MCCACVVSLDFDVVDTPATLYTIIVFWGRPLRYAICQSLHKFNFYMLGLKLEQYDSVNYSNFKNNFPLSLSCLKMMAYKKQELCTTMLKLNVTKKNIGLILFSVNKMMGTRALTLKVHL